MEQEKALLELWVEGDRLNRVDTQVRITYYDRWYLAGLMTGHQYMSVGNPRWHVLVTSGDKKLEFNLRSEELTSEKTINLIMGVLDEKETV